MNHNTKYRSYNLVFLANFSSSFGTVVILDFNEDLQVRYSAAKSLLEETLNGNIDKKIQDNLEQLSAKVIDADSDNEAKKENEVSVKHHP